MRENARDLTLVRLLTVGAKGMSSQKCIASQKAAYRAPRNRSAESEARAEREFFSR